MANMQKDAVSHIAIFTNISNSQVAVENENILKCIA